MAYRLAILLLASLVPAQANRTRQESSVPQSRNAATASKPAAPKPKLQPNPVYSEILPILREKTRVPLRLPAYLPYDEPKPKTGLKTDEATEGEDLSATIEQVGEESYSIQLALGKDCTGAHVCRDGEVTGSTVFHDDYPDRRKIPVRLRRGIRGSFVDSECGAYCDESVLYWAENGYHYSISSKAASKRELIRLANSAIEVADSETSADTRTKAKRQ